MPDQYLAKITIGGNLCQSLLKELDQILQTTDALIDYSSRATETDIILSSNNNEPLVLTDPQTSDGEFKQVELFCKNNKLTFERFCESGYGNPADILRYSPELG